MKTMRDNKLWITPAKVQEDAILEQRNMIIAELNKRGWGVTSIAKMFNMDQSSVSRIINYGKNTTNEVIIQ